MFARRITAALLGLYEMAKAQLANGLPNDECGALHRQRSHDSGHYQIGPAHSKHDPFPVTTQVERWLGAAAIIHVRKITPIARDG